MTQSTPSSEPMRPVLITWWDASGEDERRSHDEVDAMTPILLHSLGWLVTDTPEHVTVVMDYWDCGARRIWRNWLAIPRGCVVDMLPLIGCRVAATLTEASA